MYDGMLLDAAFCEVEVDNLNVTKMSEIEEMMYWI